MNYNNSKSLKLKHFTRTDKKEKQRNKAGVQNFQSLENDTFEGKRFYAFEDPITDPFAMCNN